MSTRNLFLLTFVSIAITYAYFLGFNKSFELIKDEYLLIIGLIILSFLLLFFKIKLKDYEVINYINNNQISLKSSILFFLVFQVIDYYSEGGFIGMISQWVLYWLMGLLAFLVIENLNYYKNYKIIGSGFPNRKP